MMVLEIDVITVLIHTIRIRGIETTMAKMIFVIVKIMADILPVLNVFSSSLVLSLYYSKKE